MRIKRVEHIAIAIEAMKQPLDLLRDTFRRENLAIEFAELAAGP
jgi:hypothetical protein